MVKEQNTKSELALLKQQQEVSSIQEQQLSNLQKDTIHNKNPSIIIWKQYKKQSAPSNIQKHFLLWSHSYFVLPEVILLPIVQILT